MTNLRGCIGSTRFGIEAHDAPVGDFPTQPSQKDGLGRMCKPHWNQYTTELRKAAIAAKATDGEPEPAEAAPAAIETKSRRAKAKASEPIDETAGGSAE